MKVEMDMPSLPEDYEYTGEWRPAKPLEHYVPYGEGVELNRDSTPTWGAYPIVRLVPKKPWRAEKGEDYWFLSSWGEAMRDTEYFAEPDNTRYDVKNYFPSKESAEASALYKAFHPNQNKENQT